MNLDGRSARVKIAVPLFYLLVSILYTYPLFFLGPFRIYGLDSDIEFSLHRFWCLFQNHDWLFLNRHWDQLNAPWGWDTQFPPQRFFDCMGGFLAKNLSPITSSNWMIAYTFPLSGWFFYLLAYEMTGSVGGSLLGGFLYMFSPWHFSKAGAYIEMAAIQWVPLYGLALYRYYKKPGRFTALWAGAAFFILFNFSFVIGFMAGLGSAVLTLFWVRDYYFKRGFKTTTASFWLFIFLHVIAIIPALWDQWVFRDRMTLVDHFTRVPKLIDFNLGTDSWIHFFIPTYYHPLWGAWVHEWMGHLKPYTWYIDDIVNPGYVAWLMALAAIWIIWKDRGITDRKIWFSVIWMGVGAGLMCLNPIFGKIILPWPNLLLYCLFPVFRFYARFGLLVSLCFCLLAALTCSYISPASLWKRCALLAVLFAAAGFELYCPTSSRIYDVSKIPPEYEWLKNQPGHFIIAEYPISTQKYEFEPFYLLWQTYHGKRLFNLDFPYKNPQSVESRLRRNMRDFTSPLTVRLLQDFGIRYILAHKAYFLVDQQPDRILSCNSPNFIFPAI